MTTINKQNLVLKMFEYALVKKLITKDTFDDNKKKNFN